MNLPRIENLEVKSKRVLVRVDLDVPIESGKVKDDTKLRKVLPTLELLLRKGARVILAGHLGNPEGKVESRLSLKPVVEKISSLLDKEILFSDSVDFQTWEDKSKTLLEGEILCLENLFFFPEEESGDLTFAQKLANLADFFVNDAFSLSHLSLASTIGIPKLLRTFPGTLMHREVDTFYSLLSKPEKPFVAIVGGSRVSTKLKMLNSLLPKVNTILLGGGMAYTFLKSRAVPVGSSVLEKDFEVLAHQFIDKAGIAGVEFHLPQDHIIADTMSAKAKTKSVDKMGILDGWMGMDIGSRTISQYEKIIKSAGTIFWTGPMGVIEYEKFQSGTIQIAKAIAKSNAKSIVGGYDTVSTIYKSGLDAKITHLSTGNGACLELIEGKILPAIQAIVNQKEE